MNTQIYPLGEQDFKMLRDYNNVYIDKTQYIPLLLRHRFYFLSRPRRFGKSLFLSTLEQFFLGRRELFKGLAIDAYPWEWEPHPIIKISFATGNFRIKGGLVERINQILSKLENQYGCQSKYKTTSARFDDIISFIYKKFNKGVVILIDEYEKPLLDTYGEEIFESNRVDLSEFFSVFKDNTDKIRMLFITGVTRFGRLNIFSGLNNLQDISLMEDFTAICGITQHELEEYLMPGVEDFARKKEYSIPEALDVLKEYYDGYHFSGDLTDVYNPWSLLNCLTQKRLVSEWIKTGTSNYLLTILKKMDFNLEKLLGTTVSERDLNGLDADMMNPVTLLYQSGYLTIKTYDNRRETYTVAIPNHEVRTALLESIIPFYLGKQEKIDRETLGKIFTYIEEGNAMEMMKWLSAYFSKVSYASKLSFERDFQFLVLSIFLLVKDFSQVHMEYAMSSGRTDLVVEAKRYVYVFEFKIGDNADNALRQIEERGYAVPWSADGRKVFKIGAAFSADNNGMLSYKIAENCGN